jgi:ubiquinone/menaquinone biosynthesis C-methylase UbiE
MDSLRNLREKWDRLSRWYDFATAGLEVLIFRRLRSQLLKSAAGRVLEVAGGTGANLIHYASGTDVVIVDLSPRMLLKARKLGARTIAVMDAQYLAFRDSSFETVVSTLGTCTFSSIPSSPVAEVRSCQEQITGVIALGEIPLGT